MLTDRELARQVAMLERRVGTIEEYLMRTSRARSPAPLAARNARRAADGQRLREAIRAILATHPDKMSRKAVRRALERQGFTPLRSEGAIGWHMRAIRRIQSVNENTSALTPS